MNELTDFVQRDSDGDSFCRKYGAYVTAPPVVNDTLRQLEKNYESAFGEAPSADDMKAALEFVELVLAEIGETAPCTRYSSAAMNLSWMFGESVVKTAERLYSLREFSPPKVYRDQHFQYTVTHKSPNQ